jgi:hypothetical protein
MQLETNLMRADHLHGFDLTFQQVPTRPAVALKAKLDIFGAKWGAVMAF